MKILYIEDDDINLLVIVKMLKEHHVTTCKTADEGKRLVQTDAFDLVFLDMNLGASRNEGAELLLKIRELGFSNPIVAISGYASEDEQAMFMEKGFDAYFTKPINKAKLVDYIDSIA